MPVNPIFFVEHNLVDRIDEVGRQVAVLSGKMDIIAAILSTMSETQKLLANSVMMGRVLDSIDSEPTWEDEYEVALRDEVYDFFLPDTNQRLGRTFDCNAAMDFLFNRAAQDNTFDHLEPISGLTLAQLEFLFDILLDTDVHLDQAVATLWIDVYYYSPRPAGCLRQPNYGNIREDLRAIFELDQCGSCWVWTYADLLDDFGNCIGCQRKTYLRTLVSMYIPDWNERGLTFEEALESVQERIQEEIEVGKRI